MLTVLQGPDVGLRALGLQFGQGHQGLPEATRGFPQATRILSGRLTPEAIRVRVQLPPGAEPPAEEAAVALQLAPLLLPGPDGSPPEASAELGAAAKRLGLASLRVGVTCSGTTLSEEIAAHLNPMLLTLESASKLPCDDPAAAGARDRVYATVEAFGQQLRTGPCELGDAGKAEFGHQRVFFVGTWPAREFQAFLRANALKVAVHDRDTAAPPSQQAEKSEPLPPEPAQPAKAAQKRPSGVGKVPAGAGKPPSRPQSTTPDVLVGEQGGEAAAQAAAADERARDKEAQATGIYGLASIALGPLLGELSDMPLQPGVVKFEFAMGAHGLVWTQGTTIVERVSCQARFLGVRPGWSISMVKGMPITDSVTCWHELQKCKKSGLRYSVYFLKDEASIREDLTKAEAERQKRATKAPEERRLNEAAERQKRATKAAEERRLNEAAERLEQQARATAAAERQKQARKSLEMPRKDFEAEIKEARALAGRKRAEARERAQQSDDFALDELTRLMTQVTANETQNALILDAAGKITGAGSTAKSRAARISAEIQEKQVKWFMTLVQQLYAQKPGTILDELLDNQKETDPAGFATPLQIQLLAEVCTVLRDKYSARPLNEDLQDEMLAIATWVLYAMQDVDIDRLFCFEDAPELPEGLGEPALRDEFYSRYRQNVGGKRNPQMFQVANWAPRVCFDSAGDQQDALDGLRAWIRWARFLRLSAKTLEKPMVVTRGLCGLPSSLVDGFRAKAAGDRFFWAAPSSTTVDASISEAHCNQQAPKKNTVLFAISGVTRAFPTMELSAYPGEREWLLPPFTALVVERVVDGAPLQLHFNEVRADFEAASRRLSMWHAESQRRCAKTWPI
ncbi:unnamed protein product [Prorocentrum cordatum]|uniref:NAD(P)(+)--arginine ADP-ribosyltransferase n=1 Tax=Prorocentrum cordatum TaxID=2364126 RepID=A0ABN9SRZ1_9DINO|nr:unnamed protein product [Polarella glacialis]